ncbi:FAD/NAD(P)-binding oxidoreductase [Streptomyces sp. ME03-5709C]|nr:FAD/NAD(P)-binding oxidoreductase [Streptomyces sp. ME03-5709C]
MPHESENRLSVVVIGGGYAGIRAARELDDIADVVLVEPRDSFRHNIGALRATVQPDWADNIFMSYERLLTRGTVVHERAVRVEPGHVELASGQVLRPDFLVLATGSRYPFPAKDGEESSARSKENYARTAKELEQADHALVLGAGAVGIEMVGEILAQWPGKKVTLLDPSSDVLGGNYPEKLRTALRKMITEAGVDLRLGEGLTELPEAPAGVVAPFTARTTTGRTIEADLWLRCFGSAVPSDYLAGSLAAARTTSGTVRVGEDMRVEGHETVYAVGDIADLGLPTAFLADIQAEVAAQNIRRHILGEEEGQDAVFADPFPHLVVPFGPGRGTGWLVHQEDLLDDASVAQLKGDHLLVAMYTDKLGLTEGAWTLGH